MSPEDTADYKAKLEQVLADYVRSAERGEPLDRQQLLSQYPDLADDLRSFFRNRDAMQGLAEPVQEQATTIGRGAKYTDGGRSRVRYFGDYELIEEIARGGMGVVYKARQTSLNRTVAVKMILSAQLATDEDVQRFHTEAEAAANLDHPNIVPIYEVGEHEGQHYFSMAYVEGCSLADLVRENPLPSTVAAEYAKTIAAAIDYAHTQGVVHRDLKPSNVLVDQQNQARITDFGLAKRVGSDSEITSTGQILGTPGYMPPEQALSDHSQVGPKSDVYSLGAVLYCLITGRPPFAADNVTATLLQLIEEEPVSPRALNPAIDQDLETVCLKCLEKQGAKRYSSAQALVDELGRYLRGEPILARPVSSRQRAWRWCRRNPVVATLSGIAVALVLSVASVSVVAYWQTSAALRRTELAQQQEEQQRKVAEGERRKAVDAAKEAEAKRVLAEQNYRRSVAQRLAVDGVSRLEDDPVLGTLLCIEASQLPGTGRDRPIPLAEEALHRVVERVGGVPVPGERYQIRDLCLSPNGKWVLGYDYRSWLFDRENPAASPKRVGLSMTASPDGRRAVVYDSKRKVYQVLSLEHEDPLETADVLSIPEGVLSLDLQFSPNSEYLAGTGQVGQGEQSKDILIVWKCREDGPPEITYEYRELGEGSHVLTFSRNASWLAVATTEPTNSKNTEQPHAVLLWELKSVGSTSQPKCIDCDAAVTKIEFGAGGRWLCVSTEAMHRLWRLDHTGQKWTMEKRFEPGGNAEISGDGNWLATTGMQGKIRLWNLTLPDPQNAPLRLGERGSVPKAMTFAPDSKWLAAKSGSFVTLWRLPHPREVLRVPRSGKEYVSGTRDTLLITDASSTHCQTQVWDLTTGKQLAMKNHDKDSPVATARTTAMTSDHRLRAYADDKVNITVWDATDSAVKASWQEKMTSKHSQSPAISMEFSSDGSALLVRIDPRVSGAQEDIVVRRTTTGIELCSITLTDHCRRSMFAVDGQHVLAYFDSKMRRYRLSDGNLVDEIEYTSSGRVMATSPNGRLVVTLSKGTLSLNDLKEKKLLGSYSLRDGETNCMVSFRDDAQRLAIGGWGKSIDILQTSDMKVVDHFELHHDFGEPLAFLDAHRLLVANGGANVVWEIERDGTYPPLERDPMIDAVRLGPHEHPVDHFKFADDAERLVSVASREVCLWDLTASKPTETRHRLVGHSGEVTSVRFSADNKWLVTGTGTPLRPGMSSRGRSAPFVVRLEDGTLELRPQNPPRPGDGEIRVWQIDPREWNGVEPLQQGLCSGSRFSPFHTAFGGQWAVAGGGYISDSAPGSALGIVAWHVSDPTTPRHEEQLLAISAPEELRTRLVNVMDKRARTTHVCRVSSNGKWAGFAGEGAASLLRLGEEEAKPTRLDVAEATIKAIAFAADESLFAVGGSDGIIRAWTLTGEGPSATPTVYELPESVKENAITNISVSHDGSCILVTVQNSILLYHQTTPPSSTRPVALKGVRGVRSTLLSPDAKWLMAAGSDEIIVLSTGRSDPVNNVAKFPWPYKISPGGLYFSPDGNSLMIRGAKQATLTSWTGWKSLLDAAEGKDSVPLQPPTGHAIGSGSAELVKFCFSPCSQFLAIAEKQGATSVVTKLRLARRESPEPVRVHTTKKSISAIGLSARGERVFVKYGSHGFDACVIEARTEALLEAARTRAGRDLGPQERRYFEIDSPRKATETNRSD